MVTRTVIRSGWLLGLFGAIVISLVSLAYQATKEPIERSEYQALLKALNSVMPVDNHDNDLVNDTRPLKATMGLGLKKDAQVYRARLNGKQTAAAFPVVAPDGYNGPINMLMAVNRQGVVLGVRVISHSETPGLGDRIESRRSDWAQQFRGTSLNDPEAKRWAVRKDGGIFDQFTGATITPRIIVKAVHKALTHVELHPEAFFDE
jgi:H+/Na+-translocating ferredoxin:NAD+ oxidoreductase subunit G